MTQGVSGRCAVVAQPGAIQGRVRRRYARRMASRRPTIADIAARAGVSKMAVSFALNDRPGVSDPTRAKIRALADELG